jgi:hypothetical protein
MASLRTHKAAVDGLGHHEVGHCRAVFKGWVERISEQMDKRSPSQRMMVGSDTSDEDWPSCVGRTDVLMSWRIVSPKENPQRSGWDWLVRI